MSKLLEWEREEMGRNVIKKGNRKVERRKRWKKRGENETKGNKEGKRIETRRDGRQEMEGRKWRERNKKEGNKKEGNK